MHVEFEVHGPANYISKKKNELISSKCKFVPCQHMDRETKRPVHTYRARHIDVACEQTFNRKLPLQSVNCFSNKICLSVRKFLSQVSNNLHINYFSFTQFTGKKSA